MQETIADLLVAAHAYREGRSSVSLHEGEASVLRQTVTALLAGKSMEIEHPPLEGWVLVVTGELNLRVNSNPDTEIRLPTHSLIQMPQAPITLTANVDSGMLLTVAMGDRPR